MDSHSVELQHTFRALVISTMLLSTGIPVPYVNSIWELKTRRFGVRQLNPKSDLEISQLSNLLGTYLLEVRKQLELHVADHVYSSTKMGAAASSGSVTHACPASGRGVAHTCSPVPCSR